MPPRPASTSPRQRRTHRHRTPANSPSSSKLTNTSTAAVTFTIRANNYRGDGPWTYQVAAGATVTDYFNATAYASGWYDFTVTANSDTAWTQRFTGHLETNTPSVSG
ncbi:phospholipase domain-containing protein [Kribbella sp. NPDC006257]|uniref:phospholipase domain-containing protein n=1 Tax=Kribbella sp. NPDC006257 TaxID=3156738 RepID=UPI0033A46476